MVENSMKLAATYYKDLIRLKTNEYFFKTKRERTNCPTPTWMPKYFDIYVHVQYKEINSVCSANHSIQNDKINEVF